MTATAKLFKNGQSQAVRLPKEFRFENQNEVFVKKYKKGILLIPKTKDIWDVMIRSLDEFSEDFLKERTQPEQKREELF
ncbi:antitoxin [Nitrosophilus alvini]|uniref:antitoxin n=1 Tax=Nitrosophilus alvini TaxID=2714855 RepID=UPI00190CBAEE|nr:type II toxin-antitoxin system VapB family antitoxin [Nitrosophilus alvini]